MTCVRLHRSERRRPPARWRPPVHDGAWPILHAALRRPRARLGRLPPRHQRRRQAQASHARAARPSSPSSARATCAPTSRAATSCSGPRRRSPGSWPRASSAGPRPASASRCRQWCARHSSSARSSPATPSSPAARREDPARAVPGERARSGRGRRPRSRALGARRLRRAGARGLPAPPQRGGPHPAHQRLLRPCLWPPRLRGATGGRCRRCWRWLALERVGAVAAPPALPNRAWLDAPSTAPRLDVPLMPT